MKNFFIALLITVFSLGTVAHAKRSDVTEIDKTSASQNDKKKETKKITKAKQNKKDKKAKKNKKTNKPKYEKEAW